jgi:hypothetical protein
MINLAGSGTISSQQVSFAWTTGPSTSASVTSSKYLNQNSWNHVAITIDSTTPASSTITIYSNGVGQIFTGNNLSSQTVDNGSPFYIGAEYGGNYQGLSGYLSDFRFVRGQLVYKSNFVPPAQPLTAIQNSSLLLNYTSAGVYDAAMMNNMETVGDAKLSTAISKFGGSSMYFDGTGDYLNSPNSLLAIQGSEAFTLEAWIYPTSVAGDLCIYETRGGSGWVFFINSSGKLQVYDTVALLQTQSTVTLTANTWAFVSLVRATGSSTVTYYVGGTAAGTFTLASFATATQIRIGIRNDGLYPYIGYIDDLRVTKGFARYTANFTAPTAAFPVY